MKNNKLNKIFKINPEDKNFSNSTNELVEYSNEVQLISDDEDFKDLREIRENLKKYTSIGEQALNELLDVAVQSQNPRAFEVLSQLIKSLSDVNKEISEQVKKNIDLKAPRITENNITNNNLILSTNELLEKLQNKNKDEKEN